VALAGLNHKLGWRGTTNTLLNFGEGKYPVRWAAAGGKRQGAVGYLVGKPGDGPQVHVPHDERGAHWHRHGRHHAGPGGLLRQLDYAKNRPQGRPWVLAARTPAQPQVRLIEHADIKRMLLAQKAYCEGALALELYCARWWTSSTRARPSGRRGPPAAGGADAHRQELAQRVVPGGQQRWPSRSTAATATRATSRSSSTGATTA
jgi:alkylation response protein AidB-like acyl-CoA dehydrogenase